MIYVVRQDGTLVMARGNAGWGHVDLALGGRVRAAGEFGIANGRIRFINNGSGHYQPFGASARTEALNAFRNAGFRFDDAIWKFIPRN
jgi:filamentous hemagglutinin